MESPASLIFYYIFLLIMCDCDIDILDIYNISQKWENSNINFQHALADFITLYRIIYWNNSQSIPLNPDRFVSVYGQRWWLLIDALHTSTSNQRRRLSATEPWPVVWSGCNEPWCGRLVWVTDPLLHSSAGLRLPEHRPTGVTKRRVI